MTLSDCGAQNLRALTWKLVAANLKVPSLLRPLDAVGDFSVNAAAAVNLNVRDQSLIEMENKKRYSFEYLFLFVIRVRKRTGLKTSEIYLIFRIADILFFRRVKRQVGN